MVVLGGTGRRNRETSQRPSWAMKALDGTQSQYLPVVGAETVPGPANGERELAGAVGSLTHLENGARTVNR